MRNPWATETYTGPWNDKDPNWTKYLRDQVHHEILNDGIFYMAPSDFKEGFHSFEISMYSDEWKRTTYRQENENINTFKYSLTNPRN